MHGRLKLMIVDDHWGWREFLSELLGPSHSITECSDGASAIAACEQESPDWILMDIAMVPMDGLTAAAAIKDRHPDARIIFVTEHTDRMLREHAERLGAVGFVSKEEVWRVLKIIGAGP